MSQPLDITSICAWLGRHELEPHHVQSLLSSAAAGLRAHLERRCDTADEILDKLEPLDDAGEAMDRLQMTEQPFENAAAEQYRQSVDFARRVVR